MKNNQIRFEASNAIDQLAILTLGGTYILDTMYGYTEMETLAQTFDFGSGGTPSAVIFGHYVNYKNYFTHHNTKSTIYILLFVYPIVSKLYSITVEQPIGPAGVESPKTKILSKILIIKYKCDNNLIKATILQIINRMYPSFLYSEVST